MTVPQYWPSCVIWRMTAGAEPMAAKFMKYVRGNNKPCSTKSFDDTEECIAYAEKWAKGADAVDRFQNVAYVIDDHDSLVWVYPPELKETTFDAEVGSTGNSLAIILSRQAQLMGLEKGDIVNVTIRRKEI